MLPLIKYCCNDGDRHLVVNSQLGTTAIKIICSKCSKQTDWYNNATLAVEEWNSTIEPKQYIGNYDEWIALMDKIGR